MCGNKNTELAWLAGRDAALAAFDKLLYGPAKEGAQTRHFRKALRPPSEWLEPNTVRDMGK